MKLYLIAVLFLTALVVAPCFAEETNDENPPEAGAGLNDAPEEPANVEDTPEEQEDEEQEDEEKEDELMKLAKDEDIPKELKDEVSQLSEKRAVRLSSYSCNTLKRYGYCKYSFVKRFCPSQCGGICKDLLSYTSCRRIKYTYKKCHYATARLYCKKTCGHCNKPVRWRTHSPYWCTVKHRKLLAYYKTLAQCRALCLKTKGCKAVEWWYKWKKPCFICYRPDRKVKYTNTKDLAYPPYVSVRY